MPLWDLILGNTPQLAPSRSDSTVFLEVDSVRKPCLRSAQRRSRFHCDLADRHGNSALDVARRRRGFRRFGPESGEKQKGGIPFEIPPFASDFRRSGSATRSQLTAQRDRVGTSALQLPYRACPLLQSLQEIAQFHLEAFSCLNASQVPLPVLAGDCLFSLLQEDLSSVELKHTPDPAEFKWLKQIFCCGNFVRSVEI